MHKLSRRQWIASGVAAYASACGRKKGTGYPGYAVIGSTADPGISVVDLTRFRLAKTFPLAAPPAAVVTNVTRHITYVLTAGNGTIHVISDGLAIAPSHRVAAELADLRLSPAEERLVVLESSKPQVIELDPGTLSVRRSYPVAREAQTLDVSSTGLVAVAGSTMLECIDLTRGKHWRSQIPGQAGQIRFRSDGKLLLAADLKNRSITAWTTPELQLVAELPVAMTPENLVFNADGGQLFISGAGMDAVAVLFPYDTLEVDQTVLAGPDPGVMACSSTPPYLFVGNAKASNVSILNIDTRKVIGIVQVGQRPSCIIVTPDNQYALVLDEGSADLAVIHIQAIKPNRTKSGASLFTVLPLNGRPVNAAILPWSRQPSQAA